MQRRRRCAFDSESVEDYLQLATIGQFQTNIFYEDHKIKQLKRLNQPDGLGKSQFNGFDHHSQEYSPQVEYVDTDNLPPDLTLSGESVQTHYIMILGELNHQVKSAVQMYCLESRRNSSEDFDEELISPIKSKLCLDLAIKKIHGNNGQHVVKFMLHECTITNYEPIINVYFAQTTNYIIVIQDGNQEMYTAYVSYSPCITMTQNNRHSLIPPVSTIAPCGHSLRCQIMYQYISYQDYRASNQFMNLFNYFTLIHPSFKEYQTELPITSITVLIGHIETLQHHKYLQLTDEVTLQIEYDQSIPPITELAFYYFNRESPTQIPGLSQCIVMHKQSILEHYDLSQAFGFPINHNQILQLCYKQENNQPSWADLQLIKDSAIPDDYQIIKQSFKGSHLAYRQALTPYTICHDWKIADRYPKTDTTIPYQESIGLFCFPFGIRVYKTNVEPRCHTFIMTSQSGDRSYCSVLIFTEYCQEQSGFNEVAIVLTSQYNYTMQGIEILKYLYQYHLSKNTLPIERLICNIIDEIFIPESGVVRYNDIKFPISNQYPLCSDQALQCLFARLSGKNIIKLFHACLLECKIQLVSTDISIPPLIIEALSALIYPFEYTHILIPILPKELEAYKEAPVPYILGVTDATPIKDVTFVYLDSDNIISDQHIPLPDSLYQKLKSSLKQFQNYYNPQFKLQAFPLPLMEQQEELNTLMVREVFLQFMIALMKDYRQFLGSEFKNADFLKHKSKYKQFLGVFMESRFFNYFIQQRIELSQNDLYLEYFDDCIANPKGQHFHEITSPEVQCIPPNESGVDGIYSYERFPNLISLLFSGSRIIKQEALPDKPKSFIQLLQFELRSIYKQWFKEVLDQSNVNNLGQLVQYCLVVVDDMIQQKLNIDGELVVMIFQICALHNQQVVALQLVQLLKKAGYYKLLPLLNAYFQVVPNHINQSHTEFEPIEYNYYIHPECPKCGVLQSIEEVVMNFTSSEPLQCKSVGTLGCNNRFVPMLEINDRSIPLQSPSRCTNREVQLFYYFLARLPFVKHYEQLHHKQHVFKQSSGVVNLANLYTEHDMDEVAELEYFNKMAVHQVFGQFLMHFRKVATRHQKVVLHDSWSD